MPTPTAVINIVGLSGSLIGTHTPAILEFATKGRQRRLRPVLPAVTCSVQSSMVTGVAPTEHGVVGNGWYDRDLAEVHFWKQSNRLVRGEKVWETARRIDPATTSAVLFWWYNMYSTADWSVTPRPIYCADGRKLPDVYANPPELGDRLRERLGTFPLFNFWGPASSIVSSDWIADAAMEVYKDHRPHLSLVYLPHLDYALQKLGPGDPAVLEALGEIDGVVRDLIGFYGTHGVRVILLSEYGIEPVDDAVHVNRVLREAGELRVRRERWYEQLDAGASDAFAVCDHQVAHVYVRDPARIEAVAERCRAIDGVETVIGPSERAAHGIDHARAGDLVLVAESGRWFSYDFWLDDRRAPDFARTVDIHRKPGYDPLELFIDPEIALPKLRIAGKIARKKLGFRMLMDVIPLDTRLVRGSHGRVDAPPVLQPVLITDEPSSGAPEAMDCTGVRDVILEHLFGAEAVAGLRG